MTITHSAKIFVAGHRGMVGPALVRKLAAKGYGNLLTAPRSQLNLLDQGLALTYRAFLER